MGHTLLLRAHKNTHHVLQLISKLAATRIINRPQSAGKWLTDTLRATVTPFGGASVSSMAGDLAGTLQLVTLVTRETDDCSNCKTCFRAHRARSVHHLSWIRTLLDCGGRKRTRMTAFNLILSLDFIKNSLIQRTEESQQHGWWLHSLFLTKV